MEMRDYLKTYSRNIHKEIEETSTVKNLLSEDVSVENYYSFLKATHSAFRKLKKLVSGIENRALHGRIKELLNDLESDLSSICFKKEKDLEEDSRSVNENELLGIEYVIEGSVMGLKVIYAHLINHSIIDSSDAFAYVGRSQKRESNWSNCIKKLEVLDFEACHKEMANGAMLAFQVFKTELEKFDNANRDVQ